MLTRPVSEPKRRLPDGAAVAHALRGTPFDAEIAALAESIRRHRFPLLGLHVETGPEIAWRRDFVHGQETGLEYFRRVPYLDAARAGDHKIVWELNRHQHLVLLAQAFLLTGDERNLAEIAAQLESWFGANPFHRGINWASALEVAFRALSWIWVDHLVGSRLAQTFRQRFLGRLYQHGCHLANNLSFYFSPNTHLLGEAVALHAIGLLFPNFPDAGKWEQLGARVVSEQMHKQVAEDGSHFEQSAYYHVYALDMFLFHAILANPGPWYRDKLRRMAEYLHALLGPARRLPFLGDDDGGRFFHPYGRHDEYGRASLAACGAFLERAEWLGGRDDLHSHAVWWLGPSALAREPAAPAWESRLFAAGVATLNAGATHAIVDAGAFGPWGSGHSHSDTLSLVVSRGGDEILIDPGTFTYMGDPKWRNWFRGSIAHNTIRIDGRDQATPVGAFRWRNQPEVAVLAWSSSPEGDFFDAECRYAGFTHRRRVRFIKPDLLLIVDDVNGPPGEHEVEQLWHFGSKERRACLVCGDRLEEMEAWRSRAFGTREPAYALRVRRTCALPARFAAGIVLDAGARLEIETAEAATAFRYTKDGTQWRFEFT